MKRSFQWRVEIEVPAKPVFGVPPRRETTTAFVLPSAYAIDRSAGGQGEVVVSVNFGGLTEIDCDFSVTNNGVQLFWKLKNEEIVPISGRKAFMEVELLGTRLQKASLSAKYLALRKRLFDEFYFEGLIAEQINRSVLGNAVKFADQTIYMGLALFVLATELEILRDSGSDETETKSRVKEILRAIEQLDQAAEPQFGATSKLDGFFLRDDITGPNDSRLSGRFAKVESDFQFPNQENASPSGDQIFGLMYGLWAVVHFSGDSGLVQQARQISSRLYDYVRRNHFVLTLPNGNATRRGSDVRGLSSLMHGLNKAITGEDLFDQSQIEVSGQLVSLLAIASFWDDPDNAKQTAELVGDNIEIPLIDQEISLNSFAVHILLMALASGEVWSQAEIEAVADKAGHHLASLFYCAAHRQSLPLHLNHAQIDQILADCPDSGPTAALPKETGWHKDNRWIRCLDLNEPSSGSAEYNGLDWLLLHNLSQIVFFGP